MKPLPNLFMLLIVPDVTAKAVFHGTLTDEQIKQVMDVLGTAYDHPIRLSIVEKFWDSDYHYTILTLACDSFIAMDMRLAAVFTDARRFVIDETTPMREAVRAIIIP